MILRICMQGNEVDKFLRVLWMMVPLVDFELPRAVPNSRTSTGRFETWTIVETDCVQ